MIRSSIASSSPVFCPADEKWLRIPTAPFEISVRRVKARARTREPERLRYAFRQTDGDQWVAIWPIRIVVTEKRRAGFEVEVVYEATDREPDRPGGRRFGSLVHGIIREGRARGGGGRFEGTRSQTPRDQGRELADTRSRERLLDLVWSKYSCGAAVVPE